LNGWYLYQLPFRSKTGWTNQIVGGWQISGDFYVRSGMPFSVYSALFPGMGIINNASVLLFATLVPGQNFYAKQEIPGVTQPGTKQWVNPNAFQSVWDSSSFTCFPTTNAQNCQDGNSGRNVLRSPSFQWLDFTVGKRFRISEKLSLTFSTEFYNLLNHPNFGIPGSGFTGFNFAGIPGKLETLTSFGTINNTVSPNTGLLGSGLGGDSSVRMIALHGQVEF